MRTLVSSTAQHVARACGLGGEEQDGRGGGARGNGDGAQLAHGPSQGVQAKAVLGGEGDGCQGGAPGQVGGQGQLDGQAIQGQLPGRGVDPAGQG